MVPRRHRPPPKPTRYRAAIVATSILGGLLMLAGGVFAAQKFSGAGMAKANVDFEAGQPGDRVVVTYSEPGTDWSQLTIASSEPARVSIGGRALAVGVAPLPMPPGTIVPGETVRACALGPAGDIEVVLRDVITGRVVSSETLQASTCLPLDA